MEENEGISVSILYNIQSNAHLLNTNKYPLFSINSGTNYKKENTIILI